MTLAWAGGLGLDEAEWHDDGGNDDGGCDGHDCGEAPWVTSPHRQASDHWPGWRLGRSRLVDG